MITDGLNVYVKSPKWLCSRTRKWTAVSEQGVQVCAHKIACLNHIYHPSHAPLTHWCPADQLAIAKFMYSSALITLTIQDQFGDCATPIHNPPHSLLVIFSNRQRKLFLRKCAHGKNSLVYFFALYVSSLSSRNVGDFPRKTFHMKWKEKSFSIHPKCFWGFVYTFPVQLHTVSTLQHAIFLLMEWGLKKHAHTSIPAQQLVLHTLMCTTAAPTQVIISSSSSSQVNGKLNHEC